MKLTRVLLIAALAAGLGTAVAGLASAHDSQQGSAQHQGQGMMKQHGQGMTMKQHGMMGMMKGHGGKHGKMHGFRQLLSVETVVKKLQDWVAAHVSSRLSVGNVQEMRDLVERL